MTRTVNRLIVIIGVAAVLASGSACGRESTTSAQKVFSTPEEAAKALVDAAKRDRTEDLTALFGPDVKELVDSSDPVRARQGRQVFAVAAKERLQIVDEGAGKTIVVGNEAWPFPVPLVKEGNGWRFDTASGKEEVLARRIGRNELSVIAVCRAFVAAQRRYASVGHDGQPAGLYASVFRSDDGKQNGLYWPVSRRQRPSPLGDLIAEAATDARTSGSAGPSPFHGYYFRILTAQGAAAAGGAMDYITDGKLARGFALVAWPATYQVTGVTTFIVNHEGVVREQDLGDATDSTARAMTAYNPDASWTIVQ